MDFVEGRMSLRSFVSLTSSTLLAKRKKKKQKERSSFGQVAENEEDMYKNRADAKACPSRFKLRFYLSRCTFLALHRVA